MSKGRIRFSVNKQNFISFSHSNIKDTLHRDGTDQCIDSVMDIHDDGH